MNCKLYLSIPTETGCDFDDNPLTPTLSHKGRGREYLASPTLPCTFSQISRTVGGISSQISRNVKTIHPHSSALSSEASFPTSPLTGEVAQRAGEGDNKRSKTSTLFTQRSRTLRKNQTDAEKSFWKAVRNNQLGYKFRRQQAIDNQYIADFVCFEKKLIIEIDGGQHADNAYDQIRDMFLMQKSFRIVRFWNNEVLAHLDACIDVVLRCLNDPLDNKPLTPTLSRKGRGCSF
jgi:very-short-patch-repair endonuclease